MTAFQQVAETAARPRTVQLTTRSAICAPWLSRATTWYSSVPRFQGLAMPLALPLFSPLAFAFATAGAGGSPSGPDADLPAPASGQLASLVDSARPGTTALTRRSAVTALNALAATAAAAREWRIPRPMREANRSQVFEVAFGVTRGFYRGDRYNNSWGVHLSYLAHLRGGATGPALGAALSGHAWARNYSFYAAFKFEYDFKMFRTQPLALFVGPFFTAGWHHGEGIRAVRSDHGVNFRMIFLDRWSVFVQPLIFSAWVHVPYAGLDARFRGSFSARLGGGVTF